MKRINSYTALLAFLFLASGLASCIKDNLAAADAREGEEGTATVNLYFGSREGASAPTGVNEGIKTLRVIITDAQNKVLVNKYLDHYDTETTVTTSTLSIMGLPANGTANFYVIGNEKSVGGQFDGIAVGSTLDKTGLQNTVVTNPAASPYFPKSWLEIEDNGLPMTGVKENVTLIDGNTVEIPLVRAVAKLVLHVDNRMDYPFRIKSLSFGSFVPDRGYLFEVSEYPEGLTRAPYTYIYQTPRSIQGGVNNKDVFIGYIFPTELANDGTFNLSMEVNGHEALGTVKVIQTTETALPRNCQMEITATVDLSHPEITLYYEVAPWAEEEIVVPPFN